MANPICLYCGYSRAVQVAGCEHATLPEAPERTPCRCGWPLCRVQDPEPVPPPPGPQSVPHSLKRDCYCVPCRSVCRHGPVGEEALRGLEAEVSEVRSALGVPEGWGLLLAAQVTAREADAKADAVAALATEREKSNLLAAEMVDLQRQVVALQAELEQERRVSGRLRADLESAQQPLSEAERGGPGHV